MRALTPWDIALYPPAPRAGSGQNSLRCF
nr:hypothetical protein [Shigella sonnei]